MNRFFVGLDRLFKMKIVIKASDVGAVVGLNKFKSKKEVLDELWKKYSPENFTTKTKNEEANEALDKSVEARKVLASALAYKAKDSTDAHKTFRDAEQKINNDKTLDAADKLKVIDYVRSKVYTVHGTRKEDQTATLSDLNLVKDNGRYEYHVMDIDENVYVVVGKIDRIEILEDGTKILVEIKNRMRNLFHRVWPYEMCQVQMYLEMLDLEKAKLIEQYNTEIAVHEISRDRDFFNDTILAGLADFCKELQSCVQGQQVE